MKRCIVKAKNKNGRSMTGIFPAKTWFGDVAKWMYSALGENAVVVSVEVRK